VPLYMVPQGEPIYELFVSFLRCQQGVDRCFVANGVVANQARERNLSDDQIICHGLPIRPAFSTVNAQANKLALRSKLGLDTHASTVMLIGGGEGMGKIAAITEALSRRYEQLPQWGSIQNEE
jgi:UDP-N-acetylglucosamine:LPS N-acetylglucosamine transferase